LATAPATATLTLTVAINGTPSSITVSIGPGVTDSHDITHTAPVNQGDFVELHLTSTAADNSQLMLSVACEIS
jgi:hypothetical protein